MAAATEEQLAGLLTLRPDLCAVGPRTLAELAEAAVQPHSLAGLHRRCSRPFRQVLEALCLVPSPVTPASLARYLGTEEGDLAPLLDRLEAAFVLRRAAGGELVVNPGLRAALPHPGRLGPPLHKVLAAQSMDALRAAATRWGLAPSKAKGPTVELLAEHLADPASVARTVKGGPNGTAELAEMIAARGPEVALHVSEDLLARDDRTPAGFLLRRGLLVSTGWHRAVMPAEVALALRGGRAFPDFCLDPPPLDLEDTPASPDPDAAEAARRLVADLAELAELWAETPARLLQAGGLGVREIRRAAKALARPEPDVARLVDLAQLARLVTADDDDQLALPTRHYDRWRSRDLSHRWTAVVAAWLAAPIHLSLAGSPGEDGKPVPALLDRDLETTAVAQRRAVLDLLAQLPPGRRATRASVVDRLVFDQPALFSGGPVGAPTLVGWYLDEADRLGVTSGDRLSSFGRALLDDAFGDRSASGEPPRGKGPAGERLAGDGFLEAAARCLADHLPPLVDHLVLQADLTALAPGELRPELRAELELLADLESSGTATLWRFTPRSLERALDAGRTAEDILGFLRDHAPKGVPQPLAYLVADLGRRFGQVRVGPAAGFVRADDPALLAELVGARRLSSLGLRLLAPTVAATQAPPDRVVAALRAAGYLAAAEDAAGDLVVSRPAARRASLSSAFDEDDEDDDEDDDDEDEADDEELDELFAALVSEDPALVAAMTGLPEEVVLSLKRTVERGGLPRGLEDPAAMARRLKATRPPTATATAATAPAALRAAPVEPDPGPRQLRLVHDRDGRPSRIGRTDQEISALLELAVDNDWLVRLSCSNGRGERRELDAQVLGVDDRTLTVQRLPRGDLQEIARRRVHWLRILTEQEEEARL